MTTAAYDYARETIARAVRVAMDAGINVSDVVVDGVETGTRLHFDLKDRAASMVAPSIDAPRAYEALAEHAP